MDRGKALPGFLLSLKNWIKLRRGVLLLLGIFFSLVVLLYELSPDDPAETGLRESDKFYEEVDSDGFAPIENWDAQQSKGGHNDIDIPANYATSENTDENTVDSVHSRERIAAIIEPLTIRLPMTHSDDYVNIYAESEQRILVVTAVNYGHLPLVNNWIASFNRFFGSDDPYRDGSYADRVDNPRIPPGAEFLNRFLIVAMDTKIYLEMRQRNLSCVLATELVADALVPDEHEAYFGSAQFNFLTRLKLHVIYRVLLHYRVDVLFSDVDIAFFNSTLFEYLSTIPSHYELIAAEDSTPTKQTLCSCFMLVRAKSDAMLETLRLIEAISLEFRRKGEKGWPDQELLHLFLHHRIPWLTVPEVLINTFTLPIRLFPNGYYIDHSGYDLRPLFIHANFRTGLVAKIEFLKSHNAWYLEDLGYSYRQKTLEWLTKVVNSLLAKL